MPGGTEIDPDDELDGPIDESTGDPPEFDDARHSALTPMGEVESIGSFANGLGARRTKIAIFGVGGMLMLLALLAALQ